MECLVFLVYCCCVGFDEGDGGFEEVECFWVYDVIVIMIWLWIELIMFMMLVMFLGFMFVFSSVLFRIVVILLNVFVVMFMCWWVVVRV